MKGGLAPLHFFFLSSSDNGNAISFTVITKSTNVMSPLMIINNRYFIVH